jgi:HAMP domain-containing protein
LICEDFALHIVYPARGFAITCCSLEIHRLLARLLAEIHRSFTTLNQKKPRHDPTETRNPALSAQQAA